MSTSIYNPQYHYVLEITVNNKIYVCKHSTDNPIDQDDYTGSGNIVKRYVRMFGAPAKQKLLAGSRVLHECATEDEAYGIEEAIVTWKFVNRKDTLNKVPGGKGGGKGAKLSNKAKANMSIAQQKRIEENRNIQLKRYEDPKNRKKTSDANKKRYEDLKERKKSRDAAIKHYEENPERAKNQSNAMLKHYEDPKNRERQSAANIKRYEDPEERAKTKRHTINALSNKRAVKSIEFVDTLRSAFKQ